MGLFLLVAGGAGAAAPQEGLLRCWGHSLPDDGQCPGVFPPDLPAGCRAGEWPLEMGLSAKGLSISSAQWGKGRVWWVAKTLGNAH